MIYKNFLYFIIAVALFVTAPSAPNNLLPQFQDIIIIPFLVFLFSLHIKRTYQRFRKKHSDSGGGSVQFRNNYLRITNVSLTKALIVFTLEIYLFDLKAIVMSVFRFGGVTFGGDVIILSIFILHFAIVWYWGYKTSGDIIYLSESISRFISDNIKFNLAIVIPWLMLTLGTDLLRILNIRWVTENSSSPLFQMMIFGLFLIIFLLVGPLLIVRLWDCKPLPEGYLRSEILKFTYGEGVKFKEILSWNSLSRSLLTAGVLGYFPFFRFLLITPELIKMLSTEEILAVVSHETGHVKRKHILYYLLLFIGFALISGGLISIINLIVLSSPMGIDLLTGTGGVFGIRSYNLMIGITSILIFILYFRFIFGYFMRNFEREADIYCFDSGIDPAHMISSFEKLGGGNNEKRGSNWHHFSIVERIEFLEECRADRTTISAHRKKVKKGLLAYALVLISIIILTISPMVRSFSDGVEKNAVIKALKKGIEKSPMDHRLYSALASLYHETKNWESARDYYEKSLSIKYEQPETLNNLAWLLVTCEDETFRERKRGLRLAKAAAALKKEPHIFDTLAEAYLLNEKYEEAVRASETALALETGDKAYLEEQLKKMKKYLSVSGSTIKL